MWRFSMVVVLGLLCAACGGGIDSYDGAMEAQIGVMEEMVGVLEGVTDEASAEKATPAVEALGKRLADIAAQVQKLPQPTMEEMQALAKKYSGRMQEFQGKALSQLAKLGQYESLSEAFTRAMANLKQ
jgi:hypothetical protein